MITVSRSLHGEEVSIFLDIKGVQTLLFILENARHSSSTTSGKELESQLRNVLISLEYLND